MSKGTGTEINVPIEAAIHKALQEFLQAMGDMHGVYIHNVSADWIDVSTHGKSNTRLTTVEIQSSSKT